MKNLALVRALFWVALSAPLTLVPGVRGTDWNISITADGFNPSYLEVTVGDRVYWWNEDYDFYDSHSTHSYSYPWNSGPIPVGYGVYMTAAKIGSFDYVDDWAYSGFGTLVVKPAGPPPPPSATLIDAPGSVDMAYDSGRDILYITSGSSVLRYQVGAGSFQEPFQLSGSLNGIDLSPDGNTLIVADGTAAGTNVWVHVINLQTGQSRRALFRQMGSESGTYAVAFGSDGAALITSKTGGGLGVLRRYEPASDSCTAITTSIRGNSMVSASGDGSTMVIAENDVSNGPMELYDVTRRAIITTGATGWFNYESAASRDGSLLAIPTYSGTRIYDRLFNQITNIGTYAGAQPCGVAFHPAADAVFFPYVTTSYVRAYSTTTWELLGQFDFQKTFTTPGNHAFGNGRIRISADGQTIFATVSGGVGYVRHGLGLPLTHRLVVTGSPGSIGEPTPYPYGSYWLDDGTWLTLDVPAVVKTNGTAYLANGWTGTGSAGTSGSGTEVSFSLTSNTILTWNWIPFAVSASFTSIPERDQMLLQWPSVDGCTFDVLYSTNSLSAFVPIASGLNATPPTNSFQAPVAPSRDGFYRVQMK